MNWLAPFLHAIEDAAPTLRGHGFSWIGTDDHASAFTDGDILLRFTTEPCAGALSAWVLHLGDGSPDTPYRLDVLMRIKQPQTGAFTGGTDTGLRALLARYIDFIVTHRTDLFGPLCAYSTEYQEFNTRIGLRALEQFAGRGAA